MTEWKNELIVPSVTGRERQAATRMDPVDLYAFCEEVRVTARVLLSHFTQTPGGDEYSYEGGMNDVLHLEEALHDLEGYTMQFMENGL